MRVRQDNNGSRVSKTPTYAGEMPLYPGFLFSTSHLFYDGVLFCFSLAIMKVVTRFLLGPADEEILLECSARSFDILNSVPRFMLELLSKRRSWFWKG